MSLTQLVHRYGFPSVNFRTVKDCDNFWWWRKCVDKIGYFRRTIAAVLGLYPTPLYLKGNCFISPNPKRLDLNLILIYWHKLVCMSMTKLMLLKFWWDLKILDHLPILRLIDASWHTVCERNRWVYQTDKSTHMSNDQSQQASKFREPEEQVGRWTAEGNGKDLNGLRLILPTRLFREASTL